MSFLFQCIYKNAKIKCIELLFLSYQFAAIRLDYRCATPVFFLKTIKRLYKTFSKVRSQKKNDIIWEFFPNVGPPPHPPLLGTPYPKKKFSVYFAF